jgi:cytochrome c oxidase subunit IV
MGHWEGVRLEIMFMAFEKLGLIYAIYLNEY